MKKSGMYMPQIRGYKAFIPTPLPPEITIDENMFNKLNQANKLLNQLNSISEFLPNTDLFISMYVKKEALLSAQIEGTQASLQDVFEFEQCEYDFDKDIENLKNINDIEEVINYIKALNYGIKRLEDLPMSLKLIKELHKILLDNACGADKTPGEFKKTQNWIGLAGCTLNEAKFVPPSPEDSVQAMGDLELYMHKKNNLPELIKCALIHYQFETIHPFLDGNGRLGRLLITFYLYWRGILTKPLLYISYYFKKNKQEYYDRLNMVRDKDDYEQWILFFLDSIIKTSESALADIKKILELKEKDQNILFKNKISSPLAIVLLNKLFYMPLISIKDIQKALEIGYQTASDIIEQFERIGILKEITGKKRNRKFVYAEYLNILSQGTQL
ncbi:Fic family protein [Candidatus Babeliales bacterium]|nr:Fic family protein [Candidatus Babeliales bacterium]MCF7899319.1 Fic family protein [Candidatus Babeliales bacterium]